MALRDLNIKISASGEQKTVASLNRIGTATGSVGTQTGRMAAESQKAATGMGRMAGAGGLMRAALAPLLPLLTALSAVRLWQGMIRESEQLERNMLRTEQIIASTGKTAGFTAHQLHEQARQLAAATLQSTEGVMQAQQVLLTFRSVSGETFTRATELAADLATVTGTNLNSAMTQLGKVLEDPIRNIGQLNRSGVSFTQAQTDMIKELIETNRQAEAQSMILDVLAGQYAGVARREAEGLAGAQDTLKQAMQEVKIAMAESVGSSDALATLYLRLADAVDELAAVIGSGEIDLYLQRVSHEFENLGKDMEYTLNLAADIFREFAIGIGADSDSIGDFLAGAFRNYVPNVRAAIQLAAVYVADFVQRTMAYGKAIAHNLDPRNWFDGKGYGDILRNELAIADAALEQSIEVILKERDAHIVSGKVMLAGRAELRAEWTRQREAVAANATVADETAIAQGRLARATADAGSDAEAASKKQDELNASLEQLRRAADPAYAALQDIQDVYEELSILFDAGLIDENQFETLAISLTDNMLPAIDEVKESVKGIGENFDEAAGGAMKAMRIMQRGLDSESEHYKNLELAIQATNVARAVAAVLTQGSGDPYTAFARMAAMAAVVASFGVQLSGSAKVGDGGTPGGQEAQGTGTVLGDMSAKSESIVNATEITATATSKLVGINQDMLRALQAMQAGITGASALIARAGQPFNTNLSSLFVENPLSKISEGAYFPGELLDRSLGQLGSIGAFFSDLGRIPFDIVGGVIDWVGKLIGGSASIRDQGIEIIGGTMADIIEDTFVRSFQRVKSKKYAWSSSKTRTYYADVDDAVTQQFSLVFEGIADSVAAGAEAIGMDMTDIEQAFNSYFVDTIRISLKGLSAEEQAAELEAVFGAMFDNLSGAVVPWIDEFQRVGEGLGETLARVATNVQVTEEAMSRLGFSLDVSEAAAQAAIDRLHDVGASFVMVSQEYAEASTDNTRLTAEAATALVEMSGGLEKFIDGMNAFVKNFASEEYQFELLTSDLTRALERVGLTVPATRDAMWDLMQSLNAGTESGREQIATLLELAGIADQYYDTLEKRADEEQRIAEQKAQEILRIAEEKAREILRIAEEAARRELEIANEKYNLEIRYLEATGDAAGALAMRRQLEIDATDESNRALLQMIYSLEDSAVAAQEAAAAEAELQAERDRIAQERSGLERQLLELQGNTAAIRERELAQLDPSNRALQKLIWTLQDQEKAANAAATAQQNYLDTLGNSFKRQQDNLKSLIEAFSDFGQSLRAFRAQLLGISNDISPTQKISEAGHVYRETASAAMLGDQEAIRSLESASRAYIEAAKTSGTEEQHRRVFGEVQSVLARTIDLADRQVVNAATRLENLPSIFRAFMSAPGFADGGYHSGGLRIVGENGPELEATGPSRIWTADQTMRMMRGGNDNAELVSEVRALRTEVSNLRAVNEATARNTHKSTRLQERWDGDGMPETRTVA